MAVKAAKSIWKEYIESYYQMDTYYRLFHLSFQKSLETSNILLDDLFKHVVDKVEGQLYVGPPRHTIILI